MAEPAYAAVDLIRAKRDGAALTGDEIRWLIGAFLSGEVAEEQMSAMLMAIYFRGLGDAELRSWTSAMVDSGERLDLSRLTQPTVDKHSTGGVGDKVSLILAPLVAACGAAGMPLVFAEAASSVLEKLTAAGVPVSGLAFPTVDEACVNAVAKWKMVLPVGPAAPSTPPG